MQGCQVGVQPVIQCFCFSTGRSAQADQFFLSTQGWHCGIVAIAVNEQFALAKDIAQPGYLFFSTEVCLGAKRMPSVDNYRWRR